MKYCAETKIQSEREMSQLNVLPQKRKEVHSDVFSEPLKEVPTLARTAMHPIAKVDVDHIAVDREVFEVVEKEMKDESMDLVAVKEAASVVEDTAHDLKEVQMAAADLPSNDDQCD